MGGEACPLNNSCIKKKDTAISSKILNQKRRTINNLPTFIKEEGKDTGWGKNDREKKKQGPHPIEHMSWGTSASSILEKKKQPLALVQGEKKATRKRRVERARSARPTGKKQGSQP